jgi:hypothetical protein
MKAFLERGLPYDAGSIWSALPEIYSTGFGSNRRAVCLGLRVLPMNFSPEGDLGGVCPFGDI